MKVSQTVAILFGILSHAFASSPEVATCDAGSGENCAATQAVLSQMEVEASEEASDLALTLLQSGVRPQLGHIEKYIAETGTGEEKKTNQKREEPVAGSTEWKIKNLALFVEQTSGNADLAAEAYHVQDDLDKGGLAEVENKPTDEAVVVKLIDQESAEVSPQEAAEDGIEFTNDDLTELHHGVNMEAVNKNTFQGDMMPDSTDQLLLFQKIETNHSTYAWAGTPWPNGLVKYCLSRDLPATAVKAWKMALVQYQRAVPCITWQDVGYLSGDSNYRSGPEYSWTSPSKGRCNQDGAIFVQSNPKDGCWSMVGKIPTRNENQILQIASPGCDSVGTTMHEIGHALGMAHEQSRPDRDEYVSVNLANTVEDAQFKINQNADTKRPYDLLSLMHYGLKDFATDKSVPVITVKDRAYLKYTTDPSKYKLYKPGNRIGLSQTDVDQLRDMYTDVVSGGCARRQLTGQKTPCVDRLRSGTPFSDSFGQNCDIYRKFPDCGKYRAGKYCCGCGGGWVVQLYGDVGVPVVSVTLAPVAVTAAPVAVRAASKCTPYNPFTYTYSEIAIDFDLSAEAYQWDKIEMSCPYGKAGTCEALCSNPGGQYGGWTFERCGCGWY